ncbi:unnamed protein product [Plutella xylostella]|uniref:(diamondback moth) hypothetical protein n=1 Tax=Plutella xylostella TaxID=51655 RepID=A0A8S4EEH9_PLUXY|nr:unnamed protein product [Plutella xylostella]
MVVGSGGRWRVRGAGGEAPGLVDTTLMFRNHSLAAYNMVAARLTDLRHADSTQVPFKKFTESGISSVVECVRFTAHWVWPAERCGGAARWRARLSVSSAGSAPSLAASSSDDGGFLPRLRAPLRPAAAPPRLLASSPAPWPPWPAAWPAAWPAWSPLHVSDLSSVPFPSSADNSLPTPPWGGRARRRPPPRHPRPRPLSAPPPHEASPESRSSSSGFGSKNASSSQHKGGSGAGSVAEWRPPPYRAPPAPPRALDAGSVDGHYEWDRASRTPTPSTPAPRRPDLVEARVQAMKEEFQLFRKRQALRRRSPDAAPRLALPAESVC